MPGRDDVAGREWVLDAGLAADLGAVLGWGPVDGPEALVAALGGRVPRGTTAKLAAVAAGEVPPGADPVAIAGRIVDDAAAARPTPAWSCWALCTVMAALAEATGLGPARVVALRRIDERAPVVDLHSVVDLPAAGLVCDPYFAALVPGPGRAARRRTHLGVRAERTDEPDGRWAFEVGDGRWPAPLRYRVLAPAVDRGDVLALCAVSATHTGVPPGPTAAVRGPEVVVDAFTHRDGGCAVRTWRWADAAGDDRGEVTEHPDWPAAARDFGTRTGIALL